MINREYYTAAQRYELDFRKVRKKFTSERVTHFKQEKIKFISSSKTVSCLKPLCNFLLLYRQADYGHKKP